MNLFKTVMSIHVHSCWLQFLPYKNLLLFLWAFTVCNSSAAQNTCPEPTINISTTQICSGQTVTFSSPDTGYDCLEYEWNFGSSATPSSATGIGPHTVVYANDGTVNVSLATDNNCSLPTGGNVGVICPNNDPPSGGDCCGDEEKIREMVFTYIGGSCPGNNSQGSDSDCSGGSVNGSTVYIKAKKDEDNDDEMYFSGDVSLGQDFVVTQVDENDLPHTVFIVVDGSQTNEIHTSCSSPLIVGETYGALLLKRIKFKDGSICNLQPNCITCQETTSINFNVSNCNPCSNAGGDSDNDGVCNNNDCQPFNPNIPTTPGTNCNDLNANTENDIIQADGCTCAGTPIQQASPCDQVSVTKNNNTITVDGLDAAANSSVQIYNDNWVNIFTCQGNCDTPTQTISGLEPVEHHVIVKLTTPSWTTICEKQEDLMLNSDPIPSLNINDITVNENGTTANLNVCLSSATNNTVTVNYSTQNGTAIAGSDYDFSSAQITLLAGQICSSIEINLQNDTNNEPTETFSVQLNSPNNATIADAEGIVTIEDDDQAASNPCDDIGISSSNGNIIVTGLDSAPISTIQVFDESWNQVFECVGNCNSTETIPVAAGLHHVKVRLRTAAWVEICQILEDITVSGGSTPSPILSINDLSIDENIGSAIVEVCLSDISNGTVTVNYQTSENSASNNIDYSFSSGQVLIPAGQSCSQISIPIIDDNEEEAEESFFFNLSNPVNATIADTQALISITDNDQSAPIDCSNISVNSSNGNIIVTGLDSAPISKLQIFDNNWNTVFSCFSDCNATESVALANGDYRVFVTLYNSNWQSICQVDESISLSNNSGSGGQPNIEISDATVNEDAGNAIVQVCLSSPTNQMVIFEYTTGNGSAIFGLDYNTVVGNRTIPAGGQCTTILVPINDDNTEEANETFKVTLSNPLNASIAGAEATVTILDNDAGNTDPNCDEVTFNIIDNGSSVEISNMTAPISIIQAFDPSWNQIFVCSATCNSTETITGLTSGTYYVKVSYYSGSWDLICDKSVYLFIGGGTNLVSEEEQDDFYFTLQKGERKVHLNWTTNTEFKNEYFVIERSSNGMHFEPLSEINSDNEDLNTLINYYKSDLDPILGSNFYRIKKIHKDGSHVYSEIKEISFDLDLSTFVIFPNPANDNFFVNLKAYAGMKGIITMHNCLGQLVLQKEYSELPATAESYSLDQIASGLHTVTLTLASGNQITKKLLVTKL